MSNAQSIDSLRELNAKLLDEIAELRKKFAEIEGENAEIPELRRKVAEVEAENAKLRQIIEERSQLYYRQPGKLSPLDYEITIRL
jgi:predicted nuclease with TOPRIM domain